MVLTIIKRFLVTEDFFEFNLKFLFLVGLWPDENLTTTQSKLYKVYMRILDFFMVIFKIITGIGLIRCTDTIILLSNIDKSVGTYNFFLKVVIFTMSREKLKALVDDIIRSGDRVTNDTRDNMIKLLVLITSISTIMITTFSMVGLMNNEMTAEAWMPFDPYESKMNLLLSWQILAILVLVPILYRGIGMQGLVCSLLIYLGDQLEDLQKRIRGLKYTKESDRMMGEELMNIVRKHIRLLRYSNSMDEIFSEYFVVQNLAVTLELCINAVLVTTVTRDQVSVIFGFTVYLGMALINAYVYCSLGNDLVLKSLEVAQAAYDSNWISWPVEYQKTILLIITVAQKPFKIRAGGVVVMDIKSFATALYNGYSIFAVLNDAVN